MPIRVRSLAGGCIVACLLSQPATAAPGLTPVRPARAPQVSGCSLVGKAFGTISTGGQVIFAGKTYPIETVHSANNQVVYSGPNVRVVFTPKAGAKLEEDANGAPDHLTRPEPHGTARIEVAGHVVTTAASEHCVIFE
jgi:hypothetical protein